MFLFISPISRHRLQLLSWERIVGTRRGPIPQGLIMSCLPLQLLFHPLLQTQLSPHHFWPTSPPPCGHFWPRIPRQNRLVTVWWPHPPFSRQFERIRQSKLSLQAFGKRGVLLWKKTLPVITNNDILRTREIYTLTKPNPTFQCPSARVIYFLWT